MHIPIIKIADIIAARNNIIAYNNKIYNFHNYDTADLDTISRQP